MKKIFCFLLFLVFFQGIYNECNNSDLANCTSCPDNISCIECASGYGIATNQCVKCNNTKGGCQKCDGNKPEICTNCTTGNCLNEDGSCTSGSFCKCNATTPCKICDNGYGFIESNKTCAKCTEKNCSTCNENPNVCSKCDETFCLGKGFCHSGDTCSKGCSITAPCTECKLGYGIDSINQKCIKCTDTCITCSESTPCSKCAEGFGVNIQTKTCVKCTNNCSKCDGESQDQCTECLITYCRNAAKKCVSGEHCLDCNTTSECKACQDGYKLNEKEQICEVLQCNVTNCSKCEANKTDKCEICQETFCLNSLGNCVSGSHCKNCTTKSKCTECDVGYGFINTDQTCVKCTANNCDKCDGNSPNLCTTCSEKLCLNKNKVCVPSEHCNAGCNVTSQCTECDEGYGLISGNYTCAKCFDPNCKSCNSDNPTLKTACSSCKTGFVLLPKDNECITLIEKELIEILENATKKILWNDTQMQAKAMKFIHENIADKCNTNFSSKVNNTTIEIFKSYDSYLIAENYSFKAIDDSFDTFNEMSNFTPGCLNNTEFNFSAKSNLYLEFYTKNYTYGPRKFAYKNMKQFLEILKDMKDNITIILDMKKNFLDNLYWMYNNDMIIDLLNISKVNIEKLAMENHKILNETIVQSFVFDWIKINVYPASNKTKYIEAIKVAKDSDYIAYINNSRIEFDLFSIYPLDSNLSRIKTENIKAEIEFKFNQNIPSKDALFSIVLIDENSINAFAIVKEKVQYGEGIKFNATAAGLYTLIKETAPMDPLVQLTLDLASKSSETDFWKKPDIFNSLIKKVQETLFPLEPVKILDDVWGNLKVFFNNYISFVKISTEIDVDVLKTVNIYLFMDEASKKYANLKNYTNETTTILDTVNKNRENFELSAKDIIDQFNNDTIPEPDQDNYVKTFSAYLNKIVNIDMILNKKSTIEFKWKTATGIAVKFESNKASLKLVNENINIQLTDNNSNISYAFAFSADYAKPGFIKKQNNPLSNYIMIGLFDCCFNRITKANVFISLDVSNIKEINKYDSVYFGHSIDYKFSTFSNVVTQFDATKKVASFNNVNNIGYFYLIRNTTMTDIIKNLIIIFNATNSVAAYWVDMNSYSQNLTYIRSNIFEHPELSFHDDVFMYINAYFKSYDSYIQSNNFTGDILINSKTVAQLICFSIDKFKFGNWSDSCLSYINSTNMSRADTENYLNTILTSLKISDEVTREKLKIKFENLIQNIYKIDFPSNMSVNNTDIILTDFNIKAYLISNTTNSSTIKTQDVEIELDLYSNNFKYLEYIEMENDINFIINKPSQISGKIFTFNTRDEKFIFSNASLKTLILKKIKFFINPDILIAYNCFALERNFFNEKGYQWLMTKFNAPFTAGNNSQGFIECPANNTNAFYAIMRDTRSYDLISAINVYFSEMDANPTWWITKSNDAIKNLTSKIIMPVIIYIPEVYTSVKDFVTKYSNFLASSKYSIEAFENTTSTVQFVCAASNISDLSSLSEKCSNFINQYNKAKDDEMQKIIDSLNNKSNGSAPVNRTELKEKLINTLKTVYSNNFQANASLLSLTQDLKTIYVTVSKIVSASINKIASKNITLILSLSLKSRLSRLLEVSNSYLEAVEFDPKSPAYLSVPTNPRSKLVSVSVLNSNFSKIVTNEKIMNGTLEFYVIDYSIFKNYDCSFLNQSTDSGNWTIIEKNAEEHYDIKTNTAKVTCKVNQPGYYAVTLHEDTLAEAAKNIGIIVGPIVAGIVLIIIFIVYCWRRRKTRYENEQEIEEN